MGRNKKWKRKAKRIIGRRHSDGILSCFTFCDTLNYGCDFNCYKGYRELEQTIKDKNIQREVEKSIMFKAKDITEFIISHSIPKPDLMNYQKQLMVRNAYHDLIENTDQLEHQYAKRGYKYGK